MSNRQSALALLLLTVGCESAVLGSGDAALSVGMVGGGCLDWLRWMKWKSMWRVRRRGL